MRGVFCAQCLLEVHWLINASIWYDEAQAALCSRAYNYRFVKGKGKCHCNWLLDRNLFKLKSWKKSKIRHCWRQVLLSTPSLMRLMYCQGWYPRSPKRGPTSWLLQCQEALVNVKAASQQISRRLSKSGAKTSFHLVAFFALADNVNRRFMTHVIL